MVRPDNAGHRAGAAFAERAYCSSLAQCPPLVALTHFGPSLVGVIGLNVTGKLLRVDRLDTPVAAPKSANRTQTPNANGDEPEMEVVEKNWLPPRDSNPDMLIQSQLSCR